MENRESSARKPLPHDQQNLLSGILSPFDPVWTAEYRALQNVYLNVLGPLILRVEHIGSTAIPGLMAKPILDIDIVMQDYGVFPRIVERLAELGYSHNGDQGIPHREAFKRTEASVPYTAPRRGWMDHHLYVCPAGSTELRRHIAFRDALRSREILRREYEQAKLAIAARSGGDRKTYARLKESECRDFVERVLNDAWHNSIPITQ